LISGRNSSRAFGHLPALEGTHDQVVVIAVISILTSFIRPMRVEICDGAVDTRLLLNDISNDIVVLVPRLALPLMMLMRSIG
jgi:hypothetical protein